MATYTERAFNVSDADEIKRIREYIAALKAELARVRAQDPVELWWDEIARIQRLINAIIAIPKSKRTDAQEDQLEAYMDQRRAAIERYRLARAPRKSGYDRTQQEAWLDITGDIVWSQTEFTQTAKTGPGSFRITLRGSHPEFRAGEEIRFAVDDLRVFGGWVTGVEQGYFFEDSIAPKTVLVGTDYNILFDRLAVRNYPSEYATHADTRMNMGAYHVWPNFPQGTLDSDMIDTVFSEYLLPDLPLGLDYTSGVDSVSTPAPVAPWAMPEAGSTLRRFMQSVSQITSAVWNIDAYMALQYHDRETVTAAYPITDGLGGISSRNLTITSDISSMINDVLVWGTLAKTVTGEVMVWHEVGDGEFWIRYWQGLIDHTQVVLNGLLALRRRTAAQNKAITTYRAKIVTYQQRLAEVSAAVWDPDTGDPRPENAQIDSIAHWGRWQAGEMREDIHHQAWLQRRGDAILTRFDEPIVRATATIWDPGYQAGQVVRLRSSVHEVDVNLVIRQIKTSFTVAKEPHGSIYYALPQYDLELGLEPEAPWNIYDYLPYPGESTPGLGGDTTGG